MAIRRGDNSYHNQTTNRPKDYMLYYSGLGEQIIFPIPPQQVSLVLPERVTTTQTLNGIWADDFGEGIIGLAISGSFGWGVDARSGRTGKQTMAKLVTLWRNRALAVREGNPENYKIRFFEWQRNCVFDCVSPEFHVDQNQQSPLLIRYQMTFQVLQVFQLFEGLGDRTPIRVYPSARTNLLSQNTTTLGKDIDFRGFPKVKDDAIYFINDPTRSHATKSITHPPVTFDPPPKKIIHPITQDFDNYSQYVANTLSSSMNVQSRIVFQQYVHDMQELAGNIVVADKSDSRTYNKQLDRLSASIINATNNILDIQYLDPIFADSIKTMQQVYLSTIQAHFVVPSTHQLDPLPLPPLPETSSVPAVSPSLSQLAILGYGSSHPAYLSALNGANRFPLASEKSPTKTPFVRFPDRNVIVDAPFDGSLI